MNVHHAISLQFSSVTSTAHSNIHFNFTDQHRSISYPFQLHWPTPLHLIPISTSLTNTAPSDIHFNFTDQHRSISYPFQLHWPTPFHQLPSFNFTDQRRSIGYPIHLRWLIALHQSPSSSLTKPSAILFFHTTPLNQSPSSSLTKPSAVLFPQTNITPSADVRLPSDQRRPQPHQERGARQRQSIVTLRCILLPPSAQHWDKNANPLSSRKIPSQIPW